MEIYNRMVHYQNEDEYIEWVCNYIKEKLRKNEIGWSCDSKRALVQNLLKLPVALMEKEKE